MEGILPYAIAAAFVAALATHLMVPPVARLAVLLRALDHPGERKLQTGALPRLRGVAIALGLVPRGSGEAVALWGRMGTTVGGGELLALAFGTITVILVGVVDDMVG